MADVKQKPKPRLLTRRNLIVLGVHVLAFGLAYMSTYLLLGDDIVKWQAMWSTLPAVLAIKLAIFALLGHWRFGWRNASFSDLSALLRAATVSSLVVATADRLIGNDILSRRIFILDWALTILILGGLRVLWRFTREEYRSLVAPRYCRKALIVGTGLTGQSLARQFLSDPTLNYLAVGFLADDESRKGDRLGGVRVLGTPDEAVELAVQHGASDILVISDVLPGKRLRALMEQCKAAELNLKVIPATDELLAGDYASQIRDVDINDLLRREPVELNDDKIRQLVRGQTVMVTGAGGSIGAEICRQVLRFEPGKLLLVERAENNLFHIDAEMHRAGHGHQVVCCLADVSDRSRMEALFAVHQPKLVFHAAAHKHVPLIESNPGEAIKNNVLATVQLAELANQYQAREFVLISTDKSVNPTSVMGVSKQIAERFVHAYSEAADTKYVVVRFGNVLASAGSVVPIFQDQIRRGGPITVTHPQMQRFFMTIPEASQLVLQAAAMGSSGEIMVLDMGEPVRIVDLARDLIRLSGRREADIDIVYTGLRPGEKLFEELYFDDERMLPTPHPKVFVAYHRPYELAEVVHTIEQLSEIAESSPEEVRKVLRRVSPEYAPGGAEAALTGENDAEPTGPITASAEQSAATFHATNLARPAQPERLPDVE